MEIIYNPTLVSPLNQGFHNLWMIDPGIEPSKFLEII